jgi:hypothetical protein
MRSVLLGHTYPPSTSDSFHPPALIADKWMQELICFCVLRRCAAADESTGASSGWQQTGRRTNEHVAHHPETYQQRSESAASALGGRSPGLCVTLDRPCVVACARSVERSTKVSLYRYSMWYIMYKILVKDRGRHRPACPPPHASDGGPAAAPGLYAGAFTCARAGA